MCSFLSNEADRWFRNIVVENRKSRENLETPKEDFMQMLLNLGNKMGKSSQILLISFRRSLDRWMLTVI